MSFSKLKDYLNRFYAEKNVPGLGIAVYYKQEPVFEHYAGFSDVENRIEFGPDTIFRLYSATKVITCTALLQLFEAGAFKLGDPLHAYMPEYKDMAVRHRREDGAEELRSAQNPIAIEHLFSMSAGIDRRDTAETGRVIKASGGEGRTLDVIRALAKEPLLFEPGTRFKYGACHDVLGALVEVLSGKTFGTYLKENLFDRIGMRDTSFVLKDEKRFCKLYNDFNGKTHAAASIGETFNLQPGRAYESGGGGLYSTVRDYILFAEALCNYGLAPNGERILRKETVNEMRTRRLSPQAQRDFAEFGGASKSGYSYGLGVRTLVDREENNALSQNGEFGWDGARGCYAAIDPEAEVALFYAQQEGGSPWYRWHGTIRNYAYASVWED
ncbi:CubicO group peptidase, beta-lactamase class C family [Paenibacillus sp. UNC496MF]|uniref:serine hydrolase domain-containing protein n=1 Tax=Paenibacillus sp. UNC496MF TaxID=1502753 RepID=UPI0008DF232B|nr:serine hydrolase domain-containing protein [Paenibacillus sp. UNC496MF]SFJ33936.1 CubicO group peptidase, beta-lactamase class C family [Paenibacillus sp. UNC496MF]